GRGFYSPSDATKWVAYESEPAQLLTIGLGVGLFAGGLGVMLGAPGVFLAFGITAASLVFLQFGVAVPVSHHIALPAAIAAAASGSVIWGGLVGVACAFVGEFMARTFLCHGDTHIDPPAAAITVMTTVVNAAAAFGFFALAKLPA
ncbi:MAG: permease, partial [Phyllobacteriaceae bacterium]|nr:permease [Phyllobacteriaceae bacterium]